MGWDADGDMEIGGESYDELAEILPVCDSLVSVLRHTPAVCLPCCMPCYHRVPKFWNHWTKIYYFCDRSVREKAWRSRKRVAQAT